MQETSKSTKTTRASYIQSICHESYINADVAMNLSTLVVVDSNTKRNIYEITVMELQTVSHLVDMV